MSAKSIFRILSVTGLILLVPFVAMQFSDEVNWGPFDFVIIGALLFGVGLLYELIAVKVRRKDHRLILSVALAVVVMYAWAELAVGIFTNAGN